MQESSWHQEAVLAPLCISPAVADAALKGGHSGARIVRTK